jgi:hypothetical protein
MSTVGGADGGEQTVETDELPLDDGDGSDAPTRDDLFEALDNRRRRYTLHYLQRHEGEEPVDVSEISTQVAAWELDTDPGKIGYSDRKNVHTALYQFHAPKLDDLGLVDYDKRCGTAELTDAGDGLWVDIGWDDDDGRDRSRRIPAAVGLTGVGFIAVAAQLSLLGTGVLAVLLTAAALLVGYWAGRQQADDSRDRAAVVVAHPPPPSE